MGAAGTAATPSMDVSRRPVEWLDRPPVLSPSGPQDASHSTSNESPRECGALADLGGRAY